MKANILYDLDESIWYVENLIKEELFCSDNQEDCFLFCKDKKIDVVKFNCFFITNSFNNKNFYYLFIGDKANDDGNLDSNPKNKKQINQFDLESHKVTLDVKLKELSELYKSEVFVQQSEYVTTIINKKKKRKKR